MSAFNRRHSLPLTARRAGNRLFHINILLAMLVTRRQRQPAARPGSKQGQKGTVTASVLVRLITAFILLSNALITSVGVAQAFSEPVDILQPRPQLTSMQSQTNNNYQAPVFTRPEARRGEVEKDEYPTTNRIDCWGGTSGLVCEEDNNYYVRQTITGTFDHGQLAGASLRQHLFPDGYGTAPNRLVSYRVSVVIHEEYITEQNRINSWVKLRRAGNYNYTFFSSSEGLVSGYGRNLTVSSQFEFSFIANTIYTDYLTFDLRSDPDWPASGYYSITLEAWSDVVPPPKIPGLSTVSSSIYACLGNTYKDAQGYVGNPINTRHGGYDYSISDLSVQTQAGELAFQREYASLSIGDPTPLSAGWTHNHEVRLIFPDDPGGQPDTVLFKAQSANKYLFTINGDGTFSAYPGLCASLVSDQGYYVINYPNQESYIFDASGKLITYSDADQHSWNYLYDASGNLGRISANNGAVYLDLVYDAQGRVASVSDQTGRSVTYHYDANGDLDSYTDVLGQTWTYEYNDPDLDHFLTRVAAPGNVTVERTEFYPDGRAWRQFDGEDNLIVELTYNLDGTTTLKDALGNIETHIYDSRGTLVEQENAVGALQEKQYDTNFRPSTIIDESGNSTQLTWSADGLNLTRIVDAAGNQTDITYDALNNPTSVTDPLGHLTTYEYSPLAGTGGTLLTGSTDALGGETTYTYTPEGFLASVTDPLGHTTSYTYNQFGQRTSMTDPPGNTWESAYDDLGRLTDTTDPLGRVTHNEYNAAGWLVRSTQNYAPGRPQNDENQWNIVTAYQYDARGNQVAVTDTYGRSASYAYDAAGRLLSATDPLGHTTTNTYNDAGQLSQTSDAMGNTTLYEYDAAGQLVAASDPLGYAATTAYNPDGTIASTTDALGRTTSYQYDELKRATAVSAPGSGVIASAYDQAGNLVASIDALGYSTTYEYDALGRLIQQTDPLSGVSEHFYDAAGNRVQTIDPRGNATTYVYDDANRLETVTDALGNVTTYEYDDLGRRMAVVDARGGRTEYEYDALDRVITVYNPNGDVIRSAYDALGRALSQTDANGNATTSAYDALGRLTSQTDALGGATSYTYDANDNQLSVTDPNGNTTAYTYDALGRPVTVTDPLGSQTATAYDAAGQVVTTTDPLGAVTAFAYDAAGRQSAVTNPLGNITSYDYNAAGHMTGMADANGIATGYVYDALGRLAVVVENYKPGFQADAETNLRTEYTYDANGNRVGVTDANGHSSAFSYDALNRLESEGDPLGNTWEYGYDALGNRVSMADANGYLTQYVYDAAGQLTSIDYPGAGIDVSFSYDAAGRRTAMTDGLGTTAWAYDDLDRPTAISDPFGKSVGYRYDAAGNRTGLSFSGKEVNYTYNAANRLTQVQDAIATTVYQYDPAGRLASILRTNPNNPGAGGVDSTYAYDAAGRLLELKHATTENDLAVYQYTYDAVGNRTQAAERVQVTGTGPTVHLSVADSSGSPMGGREVYAFNGEAYSGYHATTDASGQVAITLPGGSYRFRVDVDGAQFWSGAENHCTVGQCDNLLVTIPTPVLATVTDSDGAPRAGVNVYAFNGDVYSGYHGLTDETGKVVMRLPQGEYRFRADFNNTQFWSDSQNDCAVPGCTIVPLTVTLPVTVTVLDNVGMPHEGVPVYAFYGETYTGYQAATGANGQAQMTLPAGDYRFRADFNGTQFWSGTENHCAVPTCRETGIAVTLPLVVTVLDTGGAPKEGLPVYAYDGSTYTGFNGTTDADGRVSFTLPQGNYRFRADYNGTQFWSDSQNHCAVPDCTGAQVTVTNGVLVSVLDTDGAPKQGLKVYAFDGSTYTGYNATTDSSGQAVFTLPLGSYRFRADLNGTQFWSGATNHCDLPGCGGASVTVSKPVTVSVQDTDGAPKPGLSVYAFNASTYTGYNKVTDASGQAVFTLPLGSYRFRADLNGTQFWSGASNHCDLPGCESAAVTVTIPLTVTVQDGSGAPQSGVKVYAFNGTTYTGYNKTSDANGQAVFTLPQGSYRFRADFNGTQYWSGTSNYCDLPGCLAASVTVGPQATATPSPTDTQAPQPTDTPSPTETEAPPAATDTPALTPTETPTPAATPTATPTQIGWEPGLRMASVSQRMLRADRFLIARPQPQAAPPNDVTVTALDTGGQPKEGLRVYVFDGATYTGFNGLTGANGQATFTLPDGGYRFRADLNSTQFWSDTQNHCQVPDCAAASITVTIPLTVTVQDTGSAPREGLSVYAFDDTTYTGYHGLTDANGQAVFTLPQGEYRFRADLNGAQFWSGESNHCALPGCATASITVTLPLAVTVLDTDSAPKEGLHVYAFTGTTYTGYHGTTDANGLVTLTLPQGSYRFRADLNSTQFWSNSENHCALPGCSSAAITVTKPITVTVLDEVNTPYPDLPVYAFDGNTYTGYHGTTDANGQTVLTLPPGSYRFRADYDGVQFWSNTENHCALPGCESAAITLPGGYQYAEVTIDYAYDPLYRLTAADYDNGDYYHYAYDAVGNRLTQESLVNGLSVADTYTYDIANRLVDVDGVGYTWDANGNLLSDGVNSYAYDSANRLVEVSHQSTVSSYQYNGFGDRLTQNGAQYTLDLNSGLTQVLDDGATSYTYGLGRISQQAGSTAEYFLGDALGSVRQLTDVTGAVTFAQGYDPYGVVTLTKGAGQSAYGFTGEQQDASGLVYLRARYYASWQGRFISRDPSGLETNLYLYATANPVNLIDPTGFSSIPFIGSTGPAMFAMCFDIHTGTQDEMHGFTAAAAVGICKLAHSQDAWGNYKNSFGLNKLRPTTAHELMGWFIYENFWNDIVFDGTEPLTQELAVSSLAQIVRNRYYRKGETPNPVYYPFHGEEYLMTLFGDIRNSAEKFSLPITSFIGSFWYQVKTLPNGRIGFRIDNDTTLESATHIRDRFPGRYSGSVEDLILQNPSLANEPIHDVIRRSDVISILSSKTRKETIGSEGGGNLYETFVWTEGYDACFSQLMYISNNPPTLDVQSWPDYKSHTADPDLPGR